MNERVRAETIDQMPKPEREGKTEDEENISSLEFRRIGTINRDREGGGAEEFRRDGKGICLEYEEFAVLSKCYFSGRWQVNCWTRNVYLCSTEHRFKGKRAEPGDSLSNL